MEELEMEAPVDFPSGTVTFLFTDIEGSTALWERNRAAMQGAVERHLVLLGAAIGAHRGVHFKTVGDAVQAAFHTARDGLAAAIDGQRAILAESWPEAIGSLQVRMALHAGTAEPAAGDYLAPALNRLARTLETGYGGQILVSDAVRHLLDGDLPPEVALRSLGEHTLRGLQAAEEVFQVLVPGLPQQFPDLRSPSHRPTNLTVPPTSLIGRDEEMAAVTRMFRDNHARLVTLTGSGGSGKTRLALEIATDLLEDFADGVYFVDLAPLRDSALVLATIAATLSVRETAAATLGETLAEFLAPKRMLLLLDNCEHVIDAAADIGALLDRCPRLAVLATSREPLQIRAEQEFSVLPLTVPEAGQVPALADLADVPAVALFVARARAADPTFVLTTANAAAVVEICRRLDGLPLAIELAAARTRLLPPRALLARLEQRLPLLTDGARDLPDRQQTMRSTIAWSHDLLDDDEQEQFQILSVFSRGFTFDAAEWVSGNERRAAAPKRQRAASLALADRSHSSPAPMTEPTLPGSSHPARDTFDLLASLVAKSLVFSEGELDGEARYDMLQTIREFAQEQLTNSGQEATVRQLHAEWCLTLAERAGPLAQGPDAAVWLAELERDHANLRTALTWFLDQGDGTRLMQLAVALLLFWQDHANYSEGRQWLEAALDLGREAPPADRMRAMSGAGTMAWYQTDIPRARHWHEQALTLAREAGDRKVEALSLSNLGAQATELGDYEQAVNRYEASLAVARVAGEPESMALALHNMAHVTWLRGEPEVAASRFAEALALARDRGVSWIVPAILNGFGSATVDLGDFERAAALFREGLDLGRARGNAPDVIDALEGLANVSAGSGQMNHAALLFGAATALREEIAMPRSPTELANAEPIVIALRDALGEAGYAAALEQGRSLPQSNVIALALAFRTDESPVVVAAEDSARMR